MRLLAASTLIHTRYQIVRLIGSGGMGAVYEAIDQRLGNRVALKQNSLSGPEMQRAFEREARLLAALQHPALPVVSDFFEEDGNHFLVMQYISGKDLAELLRERGSPFALSEVLGWAEQLCDALQYLHQRQPPVIHRDIKPQNIKINANGRLMLLDFGLAKGSPTTQLAGQASRSLQAYTPHFAPLEQIQGITTTPRADIYALAATIYHLLTGVLPPDALTRAGALLRGEADPLVPAQRQQPGIPGEVSQVLQEALSMNPEQRPADVAEFRARLHGQRARVPSDALVSAAGPAVQAARPARENTTIRLPAEAEAVPAAAASQAGGGFPRVLLGIAVVLVLLLAGGLALGVALRGTATPTATALPALFVDASAAATAMPVAAAATSTLELPALPAAEPTEAQATATAPADTPTTDGVVSTQLASAVPQTVVATEPAQSATTLASPTLAPTTPASPTIRPSNTPVPSATPLPPPRDVPLNLASYGNDDIRVLLPEFETGTRTLGGVSFSIDATRGKLSTQCLANDGWPESFSIPTGNIANPEVVYIIINAGYSAGYANSKIGQIDLQFDGGRSASYDLVLGQNIREWRIDAPDVVATYSDPNLVPVYQGRSLAGDFGVLDMLVLYIPNDLRGATLSSVVLRDLSQSNLGSSVPCYFVAGLTIRARS